MSIEPTKEDLRGQVEAWVVTYPDLEDELPKLVEKIKDENPIWKVSPELVKEIVKEIQESRPPPIVKPEKLFEFDFLNAEPAPIGAGKIDWNSQEIEGIHHAQGGLGSTGVYLVKLKKKGVIVLKQKVPDVAREIFAQHLLSLFDIAAPVIRPLSFREFKAVSEKLAPAPVTVKGTCLDIHGPRMQEAGGVLMEYVRGNELCSPLLNLSKGELMALLPQIGRIVALDILLNNADRTPFLRRGDGNSGNIMLSKPGKGKAGKIGVVAIDQTVSPINDTEILNKYLDAISSRNDTDYSSLLSFLCNEIVSESASSLLNNPESLEAIKNGIESTFQEIKRTGEERILTAVKATRKKYSKFDNNELTQKFLLKVVDRL
mmetsp:Transcript_120/g.154  ORF Transcript_120/g.154 Transcript_120/m.154 type:complete len:374 (+) Transcript_120:126-1247(+)